MVVYLINKGAKDVKISKIDETMTITFQRTSLLTFLPNIFICILYLNL